MFQKNKGKILLSSGVILLPILAGLFLWDQLPDTMMTHWEGDGRADRISTKAFAVFGIPFLMLAAHLLCLFFMSLDTNMKEQHPKALGVFFWILPVVSLVTAGLVYTQALGTDSRADLVLPVLSGLLFLCIGNYLPKTRQNRSLGIKIPWTLGNEENWNKTHRFAGFVWVIGGVLLLCSVWIPVSVRIPLFLCVLLALTLLPIGYSYLLFQKHRRAGMVYRAMPKTGAERMAGKVTAVLVPLILIGVGVLLFTGDIAVSCEASALRIQADYWSDVTVPYEEIDSVSYRTEPDFGVRTGGFGMPKLSMGNFQNDEFGTYTLYAYTGAEAGIVLTSGEKTLMIALKEPSETKALYDRICEKRNGKVFGNETEAEAFSDRTR